MAYAWVEITGKVYVDQDEIDALVAEGSATILEPGDYKIESPEDAFKFLAQEKISELFPTDTPFKYNEVIFDDKLIRF